MTIDRILDTISPILRTPAVDARDYPVLMRRIREKLEGVMEESDLMQDADELMRVLDMARFPHSRGVVQRLAERVRELEKEGDNGRPDIPFHDCNDNLDIDKTIRDDAEQEQQEPVPVPPFDYGRYKVGDRAHHLIWGEVMIIALGEGTGNICWQDPYYPNRHLWTNASGVEPTCVMPSIWPYRPVIGVPPEYRWPNWIDPFTLSEYETNTMEMKAYRDGFRDGRELKAQ